MLVWFNILVVILTNSFWYQSCYSKLCNEYRKYFDKSSKKRHLSGDSNPEEERKKTKNGSSTSSTDNCDVFEEGLESSKCKEILFNCLKNLQEKVTEIYNLEHCTRNMQIKGNK